jgi:hypothetical protein
MSEASPFNRGTVDWTGDNPGIYLKDSVDGPYIALMVYFRIVLSPHGPGNAMLLLADPQGKGSAAAPNVFVGNNDKLSRYLFDNFCRKFGVFRGAAGMEAVEFKTLDTVSERGDGRSYTVELKSGKNQFTLSWGDLQAPFAADVLPARSATGHHEMYSCFVESRDASIAVNGTRLKGRPFPRDFMGRPTSSAFLAFSETWVRGA